MNFYTFIGFWIAVFIICYMLSVSIHLLINLFYDLDNPEEDTDERKRRLRA